MKHALFALLIVVVSTTPCYGAGMLGLLNIDLNADGSVGSCHWTAETAEGPDRLEINFLQGEGTVPPDSQHARAVTVKLHDSTGDPIDPQPGFSNEEGHRKAVAASAGAWKDYTVEVAATEEPSCTGNRMSVDGNGGTDSHASLAREYFDRESTNENGDIKPPEQPRCTKFTGTRRYDLYLFPGGDVRWVPPKLGILTEEDSVTIKVVAPKESRIVWKDAITCTPRDFARTLGPPPGTAEAGFNRERFTVFTDPGGPRECAQFAWNIEINHGGGNKTTLVGELKADADIRKSYILSWGAAVGLDFGSPTEFETGTRTDDMGMTEMFAKKETGQTGVTPLLTLTAHPCGMVPGRLTWCDRFSPFIGADPTRIDEGFVAGINLMLMSRVGLLLGASFYESEKLKGLGAGDTIPSGQTLDTRDTFNSDGIGFFIGLNFSDAQTLRGLFTGLFSAGAS